MRDGIACSLLIKKIEEYKFKNVFHEFGRNVLENS